MAQETAPEQAQDTQGEGPQDQQDDSGDPLQALGKGIQALVEGVQQSQLPDDVKKQAGVVQQDFQQLVDMINGGGAKGPQPMNGMMSMGGGNPNAQAAG